MRYSCFYCGSIYSERVDFCTVCFRDRSVLHLPEKANGKTYFDRKNRKGVISVTELRRAEVGRLVEEFEVFGSFPEVWKMLVYGRPGSGKSTFAFKFSRGYQGRVLYVAVEEGFSESLKQKILLNEVRGDFYISDAQEAREVKMDVEEIGPGLLVIDSISASSEILIDNSLDFAQMWICHSLKSGDYKGNSSLGHVVDLIVKMENGVAKVEKNRFGKTGEEIQIL